MNRLEIAYLLNFTLLFMHEVDSGFWREWELFGLPGGAQLFVALHFLLGAAGLYGFREVVRGTPARFAWSLILAAVGVLAFVIHGALLLAGRPQFRLPVSYAVLGLILAVSVFQGVIAFRSLSKCGVRRSYPSPDRG